MWLIRDCCRHPAETAGYALLELLAAFLIISTTLIALMQTQLNGANTERDLLSQIYANLLIEDIQRKLAITSTSSTLNIGLDQAPAAVLNCRKLFCDPFQLATFYVAHWKCRLGKWTQIALCQDQFRSSGLLAEGDGQIRHHGDSVEITIRWLDSDQQQQTLNHTYVPL